jgi:hypothetical protein
MVHELQRGLADATQQVRSQHANGSLIFSNVTCGVSGEKVTLAHQFGRFAYFRVVQWANIYDPTGATDTVTAPILVCDQSDAADVVTDENTIALRSYVSGVAAIEVF